MVILAPPLLPAYRVILRETSHDAPSLFTYTTMDVKESTSVVVGAVV
jgi:hypothetical protein